MFRYDLQTRHKTQYKINRLKLKNLTRLIK
jgi:hypothetical protein